MRTAEGKAVVSQNAVKHGLFADANLIDGESETDYELSRDVFLAEMRPVGAMECMLAERFVSLSWRLQRAERMHTEATDDRIIHAADSDTITRSMISRENRQALAESGTLEREKTRAIFGLCRGLVSTGPLALARGCLGDRLSLLCSRVDRPVCRPCRLRRAWLSR